MDGPVSRIILLSALLLVPAACGGDDSRNKTPPPPGPQQTSGYLDDTFGGQGWIVQANTAGGADDNDRGRDLVIDGSGRILVTGYSHFTALDQAMAIWALLDDGSLDPSFGTGGVVLDSSLGLPAQATQEIGFG